MARPKLKVVKRKLLGRKVKKLRAQGFLPANIYGKKVKSQAVELKLSEFLPVYQDVGETGLVDLLVEGAKEPRPILIHNVQFDPVTDQAIHADFHQVSLTEKTKAEIPVELTGESPAVAQKEGILVRILDQIEIEALPTDLPEKIEVDVTRLKKVGDMIKVGDLQIDQKKITLLSESDSLLVKIEPPAKLEEEKPPAEEEVPEGEAAPVEGEEPKETKEPEKEGARPEPVEGKKAPTKSEEKKPQEAGKETSS